MPMAPPLTPKAKLLPHSLPLGQHLMQCIGTCGSFAWRHLMSSEPTVHIPRCLPKPDGWPCSAPTHHLQKKPLHDCFLTSRRRMKKGGPGYNPQSKTSWWPLWVFISSFVNRQNRSWASAMGGTGTYRDLRAMCPPPALHSLSSFIPSRPLGPGPSLKEEGRGRSTGRSQRGSNWEFQTMARAG